MYVGADDFICKESDISKVALTIPALANYVVIAGAGHEWPGSYSESDYVNLLLSELTTGVPSKVNKIMFTPGEKDASIALMNASAYIAIIAVLF